MQLRNQVEWALHCGAILAGLPAGRYLSTKALAELHGVPKEYLSKALQGLAHAGLVESTLGPSGGYRLAKPAAEISFLDIVEAIEGKGPTFVCTEIRKNNPCRPADTCETAPCPVARAMWRADKAWRRELAAVSLADIATAVSEEVPAEILEKTRDWIADRR
ncbi:RrF2 family transcriptional regulator [Acuticoccus kandeliae]|uniref:RrF2 family transcriptional regulator n=1 Tax=Acuticoccus kandeliae TaxID=2073160 RepID=UPI000D3E486F|nr:Rrf2 family transcriptional regulator [Acuticoccus kandeliae]